MDNEFFIGNIRIRKDKYNRSGFEVMSINPITGCGVGIFLDHVTVNDLRELANYLEVNGFKGGIYESKDIHD